MQPGKSAGFVLLAALAATLLLALACERVAGVASLEARRQRETELLRAGGAYAEAIRSYYLAGPGAVKRWPSTLGELLEDRRFVQVRRHLREPYADPVTGGGWALVPAPDGGIAGVHSTSPGQPVRTAGAEADGIHLPAAARYTDWKFVPALPEAQP